LFGFPLLLFFRGLKSVHKIETLLLKDAPSWPSWPMAVALQGRIYEVLELALHLHNIV
jgi:hypothetical protein